MALPKSPKHSVHSYASYLPDEYPRCAQSGHTRSLPKYLCLLSRLERHEPASKTFLHAAHPCLFSVRSCLHASLRSAQRWHLKRVFAVVFGGMPPNAMECLRRRTLNRKTHDFRAQVATESSTSGHVLLNFFIYYLVSTLLRVMQLGVAHQCCLLACGLPRTRRGGN